MNDLTEIIEAVAKSGSHECSWLPLINAYFKGEYGFDEIRQWAKSNGMTVSFNQRYQTCRFASG